MKVHIGNYKTTYIRSRIHINYMDRKYNHNWSESTTTFEHALESLQDMLDEIYAMTINKLIRNRKRKVKVHIHDFDTWNLDISLAHVIAPALKKFRAEYGGIPFIHNEDVPEELRREKEITEPFEVFVSDEDEKKAVARWEWVLDEMIYAFDSFINNSEDEYASGDMDYNWEKDERGLFKMIEGPNHTYKVDSDGLKAHTERVNNGLRLFGKYYRCLWN